MSENNGAIILSEGENPIDVDIVFVHGLAENRISTWEKNGKVWPRDFLPDYLPNARIITWGYDSDPLKIFHIQDHESLFNHALDLLEDIQECRKEDSAKSRPIIFVGHGLGGLVVKQAMCISFEWANAGGNPRGGAISAHTIGIMFIGSPHRGSEKVKWPTTAERLALLMGNATYDKNASSLQEGSDILELLHSSFLTYHDRIPVIVTALETQGVPGIGKVVKDVSATLGTDNEKVVYIDGDHMTMVRIGHSQHIRFKCLLAGLGTILEASFPTSAIPILNGQDYGVSLS